LQEFQNSYFFAGIDDINRVETSMICLVILMRQIQTREDLIAPVDKFFKENLKYLTKIQSPIARSRLCLFLGEMVPHMFDRDKSSFD